MCGCAIIYDFKQISRLMKLKVRSDQDQRIIRVGKMYSLSETLRNVNSV